jgi:secondary thiamine-phosphate synthase enzyme
MVETEIESLIDTIEIATPGRGFQEISGELRSFVSQSGVENGLCHVFLRHTSASLLITENADRDVRRDLEYFMSRLVQDGDPAWSHSVEGPDDMPAHIRSVLTCSELTLPVRDSRLALGTWQGVYLWEHRNRPHRRLVDITIIGGN